MGEEQYLQAGDYVSVRFSGTHQEASQYSFWSIWTGWNMPAAGIPWKSH